MTEVPEEYARKAKTRPPKDRYVLKIIRKSVTGWSVIKQHYYCTKPDAQRDQLFLQEMLGNCFEYSIEQCAIPNLDAIYLKNKMLEEQCADLKEEDFL